MQMLDALAARTEAVPLSGTAAAATLLSKNDRSAITSTFPTDARAMIHCPAPSVMSSGRARAAEWVLEFEPRAPLFIEPLMGWTGSTDTLSQVRLKFPSREAAIAYARRQGLRFEVREPHHIRTGDLARMRPRLPEHHVPLEVAWAWEAPHLVLPDLEVANNGSRDGLKSAADDEL